MIKSGLRVRARYRAERCLFFFAISDQYPLPIAVDSEDCHMPLRHRNLAPAILETDGFVTVTKEFSDSIPERELRMIVERSSSNRDRP